MNVRPDEQHLKLNKTERKKMRNEAKNRENELK